MISLLADPNIQGHIARLVARMQGEFWRDFWDLLELRCVTFEDRGLDPASSDAVIWRYCQEHQILLLTNNRNERGADSLEATIRIHNSPRCLPVFTIRDPDSILSSGEYADRVIDRLVRYLFEIDNIRGTGRLYLP